MLFDLTFLCYLTTFSGKKCLSGKIICAFFGPAYRSSPVLRIKPISRVFPKPKAVLDGDGKKKKVERQVLLGLLHDIVESNHPEYSRQSLKQDSLDRTISI
jgi:hypothetical protein